MDKSILATDELVPGKIYFLSYGSQTQIIGRYREHDACNYWFDGLLHYWNSFETYRREKNYCVKSGVTELRAATLPEKHAMFKGLIEHNEI